MNAFTSGFASKLSRLPKRKEPVFQHPHYLFVQKMSQHCCRKCSAREGVIFIDCIFTSPEANQSHVLPNASLSFAFIPTPASQLEHLVHSTCPAMVHSIPEMQHSHGTESAGPWRPESVQDKFVACWCSSHSWIPPFSFSAGGYLLQCQPGLPPTAGNSAFWSSPLCNYRSNSMDAKMEVSWSMLQLWFQKEVALEWSQHCAHNSKNILPNEK